MKRKLIGTILSLIVAGALISQVPKLLQGTFSDPNTLTALLEKLQSSDGAATEFYASELMKLFNSNADTFIAALDGKSDDVINQVLSFLVAETKTADLDDLLARFSQNESLSSILQTYVNARLSGEQKTNTETVSGLAFNPETIKTFIDTNLQLGNRYDDEYSQTIANAYLEDPVLFAELLQSYSSEDTDTILDSVSDGLALLNKEPPAVDTSGIETSIAQILETIQEKLITP